MIHLNKEQQSAVRHRDGPMLVLAGPGSGKTSVLTEHIRYLIGEAQVKPETILALTFSRKAAWEMQRRFMKQVNTNSMPVFGTFHSVFYNVLRQYKTGKNLSVATFQQKNNMILSVVKEADFRSGEEQMDRAHAIRLLEEIEAYKNTGKLPPAISQDEQERFLKMVSSYQSRMAEADLIDFEDMILLCVRLFEEHPSILDQIRRQFCHILTDEFQDCNLLQYKLLRLVAGERRNIFAVGDDDQSIYRFRGADSTIVQMFLKDHPDAKVVHLIRNYRCASNVIASSDSLIRHNELRVDKPMQIASKLRGEGQVSLLYAPDAFREAEVVCERIRELVREDVSGSIAILYRTEQCADLMEETLLKCTLPYFRKQRSTFYDQKTVKEAVAYLHLSQGHYERAYFYPVLNHPYRDLARECVPEDVVTRERILHYYRDDPVRTERLKRLFSDLSYLKDLPPFAAVHYIFHKIGLFEETEDAGCLEELSERTKPYATIDAFLEHVLSMQHREQETGRDRAKEGEIIMQTIHASKGLEYDTVIVIGLQEGILPHVLAKGQEGREEERRLLYVAMTRARSRLYLCARGREDGGKQISSFIREIRC